MRKTLLILAVLTLSGCANTRDSQRGCATCGVKQPTLLQRLGLGQPLGKKAPKGFIPAETDDAQLPGIVVPDDPTPEIRPPAAS
jgi:hypothetical protein